MSIGVEVDSIVNQELNLGEDPFKAFEKWMDDAIQANCPEPTAMTLATSNSQAEPDARIVLFKGFKENQLFSFFTNYTSPKSKQLLENPKACLVFFWPTLARQIRITGHVKKLSLKDSQEYFATRPRGSQLGAWSSPQSQKIPSREFVENKIIEMEKKFEGKDVVLPEFWGGFGLEAKSIEFWEGRQFRIHERFIFEKNNQSWSRSRMAP